MFSAIRSDAWTTRGGLAPWLCASVLVCLYMSLACALPWLLLDHEFGIASGDPMHSQLDIHVWLEWALGLSIAASLAWLCVMLVRMALAGVQRALAPILLLCLLPARAPPLAH